MRTAFDGFVRGAFIGLGLRILEDVSCVKAPAAVAPLQGGRRRRRHVLEGVLDLAHELGRAGGATTGRGEFARGEVRRVRERVD